MSDPMPKQYSIAPSVLSADFAELGQQVKTILENIEMYPLVYAILRNKRSKEMFLCQL